MVFIKDDVRCTGSAQKKRSYGSSQWNCQRRVAFWASAIDISSFHQTKIWSSEKWTSHIKQIESFMESWNSVIKFRLLCLIIHDQSDCYIKSIINVTFSAFLIAWKLKPLSLHKYVQREEPSWLSWARLTDLSVPHKCRPLLDHAGSGTFFTSIICQKDESGVWTTVKGFILFLFLF